MYNENGFNTFIVLKYLYLWVYFTSSRLSITFSKEASRVGPGRWLDFCLSFSFGTVWTDRLAWRIENLDNRTRATLVLLNGALWTISNSFNIAEYVRIHKLYQIEVFEFCCVIQFISEFKLI